MKPIARAISYSWYLEENKKSNAPRLIIHDLEKKLDFWRKRLTPEEKQLLTKSFEPFSIDITKFEHPLCDECNRHWRYIRACNKLNFRCKEVKQAFEEWVDEETVRLREDLEKKYSVVVEGRFFWVTDPFTKLQEKEKKTKMNFIPTGGDVNA